jgi:hypothetical protein
MFQTLAAKKEFLKFWHDSFRSNYLIWIILIAAILRFQGIFWGIPLFDPMVQNYHPDEPKIINGAYKFPNHILTNNDLRYPTFYHYFLGTLSIPAKIIFKIAEQPEQQYQLFVSVFARFISIILGVGAVFLTFVLAKKLYNEKTGLLSASFLSLSFYHVQNSSWATLDAANSFFLVLTALSAYKMYESPSLKFYILTGFSLGILTGTKYNGITAILLILILHFYRCYSNEKNFSAIVKAAFSKNLWILIITAGVVFIITTPGIILKPDAFKLSISELVNLGAGKKYKVITVFSIFFSVIKNYITATDPLLTIVMILGLIFPLNKSWNKEIPIIAVVIVFFFAFGVLSSRQLIAVLPLTSILGAGAIYYLYKKIEIIPRSIWISFLVLWIIFEIIYNSAGIFLRTNDTRTAAAYFIEKNLPEGSTVGAASIGDYKRWSWMMPKINTAKYKIVDPLEKPEFIILTSYDYEKMEEALASEKLHNYGWDINFSAEWYKARPPSSKVFRFYDNLLNNKGDKYNYRLIKEFRKKIFIPIEFPPPQIRIYENLEEKLEAASRKK